MPLPSLQTDRLLLRPYRLTDAPDLVRLAGAREVAITTLRIPHPYLQQDAIEFIASFQAEAELGTSARFAITLRQNGELCGGIGLRIEKAHLHAELGYWIGVPYWGKGYATEAARAAVQYGFETLGLRRIFATCVTENPASARVLKKIGMQHEGCQRSHICKWGKFYDLDLYGMLAPDKTPA
jgi:[ribosomal protein S5]-alanine N-acetyltransferase